MPRAMLNEGQFPTFVNFDPLLLVHYADATTARMPRLRFSMSIRFQTSNINMPRLFSDLPASLSDYAICLDAFAANPTLNRKNGRTVKKPKILLCRAKILVS